MLKYGLITIHATRNYGSLLQTYSTYKAVQELGKDIELIDYRNEAIEEREKPISEKKINSVKDLIKRMLWGKDEALKYEGVINFLNQNTIMSKKFDKNDISNSNSLYDVFISGSDIVWGLNITGSDYTYFLDFTADDKKRISFSSSAGTKWTLEEKEKIKPLLERYDSISVREQLAADWVFDLLNRKVDVTCDPTMLWDTQFWKKFVLPDYAPKEKYVLIYAVNPDKKNIKDGIDYAKKQGMKAYFVNFYTPVKGTKTIRPVTVQQWITLFANADTVFSASYHGLLFSLYFERNVFFYNRGEKSRMISLSKELGIENREGIGNNVEKDIPIDYEYVKKILEKKRSDSWEYLKRVLAICEQ